MEPRRRPGAALGKGERERDRDRRSAAGVLHRRDWRDEPGGRLQEGLQPVSERPRPQGMPARPAAPPVVEAAQTEP